MSARRSANAQKRKALLKGQEDSMVMEYAITDQRKMKCASAIKILSIVALVCIVLRCIPSFFSIHSHYVNEKCVSHSILIFPVVESVCSIFASDRTGYSACSLLFFCSAERIKFCRSAACVKKKSRRTLKRCNVYWNEKPLPGTGGGFCYKKNSGRSPPGVLGNIIG